MKRCLSLLILLSSLLSCGDTPKPIEVIESSFKFECLVTYRSSVNVPIERQETFNIDKTNNTKQIDFAHLVLKVVYNTYREHNMYIFAHSSESDQALHTQLYQFGTPPINQFAGGHGFTGLNFVYHPTSGAEMQYWCAFLDESKP